MAATFADQLRARRVAAGLTQEALAVAARCSVAGIAALERGRRKRPRATTANLLADALGLDPPARAEFLGLLDSPTAPGSADQPAETLVLARRSDAPGDRAGDLRAAAEQRASYHTPGLSPSRPATLPAGLDQRGAAPLVGRARELGQLSTWLSPAPVLRVLVGEAGVGKTRLVAELALRALAEGRLVAVGRCAEDLAVPFRPFVEVLRRLVGTLADTRLRSVLGGQADLARLLPELGDRLDGLLPAAAGDAVTERRLLFEAVAAVLAAAAPVVVVFDDLHWADASSAALLSYLVAHPQLGGVCFWGTARPTEPAKPWGGLVAELARSGAIERRALVTLDHDAVVQLVTDAADGRRPADSVVEAIVHATDGNPFFVEELLTHLLDSGQVQTIDGELRLSDAARNDGIVGTPERVRETLHHRMAHLSGDATALLGAGAVLGREFDPLSAGEIVDLGRAATLDAVDEALSSGLVNETDGGRLAFGHALIQTAVVEQLSHLRRSALHRRAAELGEGPAPLAAGAAGAAGASVVARHWREALRGDPSVAVQAATWAARAGAEALAAGAFNEAVDAFTDAVELFERCAAPAALAVGALLQLGDASRFLGRRAEAEQAFRRALDQASAAGEPHLRAHAAMGLGRLYDYGEMDAERVATILGVLDGLGPGEAVWRPALASMLVSLLEFDDRDGVAELRERLAAIVRAAVDHGTAASGSLAEQLAFARPYLALDEPAALAGTAAGIVTAGQRCGDLLMQANGHFARAWAALASGDRGSLDTTVEQYRAVAVRLGMAEELGFVSLIDGAIAQIEGRYGDCLAHAEAAFAHHQAAGNRNGFLLFAGQYALRAMDLGESAALLGQMRDLAADQPRISSIQASVGLCAALAGEHDEAADVLARFARHGFAAVAYDANWHATLAGLAHTCAVVGAAGHAAELAGVLARSRAVTVRIGPLCGWWGSVAHHLGALARLCGRLDQAADQLAVADRVNHAMGARPFAARALLERAHLQHQLGERAEAGALVAAARAEARALGAAGIEAEADRVAERLA